MTAGVFAPILETLSNGGFHQAHPPYPTHTLVDSEGTTSNTATENRPLAIRALTRQSTRAASFFDDYYNRVHIVPAAVDFGNVSGDAERTVTLWNAYLDTTTLQSVPAAQDNVVIAGITAPSTMKPLATMRVRVHANPSGPPAIDAAFSFNFSTGDSLLLRVTGVRARLWPFAPNWREPVEVVPEFRTDIITSRSGKEQRRALRTTPRRAISYTVTVKQEDRQRFIQLLSKWQGKTMLLGDPTRKLRLSTGIPINGAVMTVPSVPAWLVAGRQIVIGNTVAAVEAIDDTTITFSPAATAAVPAGTIVRPALSGRMSGTIGASHPTSRVAEAKIAFAVDPASEPIDDGEPGLQVHAGREVFPFNPNWLSAVDQNFDWPIEQVDYGFGRVQTYQPIEYGWFTQGAGFIGATPDEAGEIEQFFNRMKGRRGEFLMPTGTDDLSVEGRLAEGTSFLTATGTDVFDNYATDTRYRAISLKLRSGVKLFRTVSGMYVDGENTVISTTRPWFYDIEPEDIAMVSWMPVFRFASDDVSFEWLTDSVVQVQLNMRSLENLEVEDPLIEYDEAAQWVLESWGEAGIPVLDAFDWLTNVRYPAIYFEPLAWVMVHEDVADSFDVAVNVEYPEIFADGV